MHAANEKRIIRSLEREAEAARDLVAFLDSDNKDLNHDMVEGETGLHDALNLAIQEIDDAEAQIAGCINREEVFKSRRVLAENRRDRIRAMIERALSMSELKSVRLSIATLSVKDTDPKPIYEDESLIPPEYWKAGDPKLDKAAIKAAIDQNKQVPGVSRSNGGISLTIRRK